MHTGANVDKERFQHLLQCIILRAPASLSSKLPQAKGTVIGPFAGKPQLLSGCFAACEPCQNEYKCCNGNSHLGPIAPSAALNKGNLLYTVDSQTPKLSCWGYPESYDVTAVGNANLCSNAQIYVCLDTGFCLQM